jgi:hypothetical protein
MAAASTSSGATADATTASGTAHLSGSSGTSQIGRLSARYASLAGSTENAQSLVQGLRSGGAITLNGTGSEAVTFTPPTRHMGWGNVNKALSLAQAQLAAQGITNPTPEQLKVALLGGTLDSGATATTGTNTTIQTVEMQGVLALRSQGMGWGKIAHTLGVRPDGRPLVSRGSAGSTAGSGNGVITTAAGGTMARQDPRHELRGREAEARGRDAEMRGRFQPETRGKSGESSFRSETRIQTAGGAVGGLSTAGGALSGGRHGGEGARIVSSGGSGGGQGHGRGGKH